MRGSLIGHTPILFFHIDVWPIEADLSARPLNSLVKVIELINENVMLKQAWSLTRK